MNNKRYPKISALTLTIKNTEYEFTFSDDTKEYTLSSRGNNEIKLRYVSGGEYLTIPGKAAKTDEVTFSGISVAQRSIFVECPVAGETLEIEEWK